MYAGAGCIVCAFKTGMDGVFRVIAEQRNSETVKTFRHWCVCVCSEAYAVFIGPNFSRDQWIMDQFIFQFVSPSVSPSNVYQEKLKNTCAFSKNIMSDDARYDMMQDVRIHVVM